MACLWTNEIGETAARERVGVNYAHKHTHANNSNPCCSSIATYAYTLHMHTPHTLHNTPYTTHTPHTTQVAVVPGRIMVMMSIVITIMMTKKVGCHRTKMRARRAMKAMKAMATTRRLVITNWWTTRRIIIITWIHIPALWRLRSFCQLPYCLDATVTGSALNVHECAAIYIGNKNWSNSAQECDIPLIVRSITGIMFTSID